MSMKNIRKQSRRPEFLNDDTLVRDIQMESLNNHQLIRMRPTFSSVMAAMGSSLAVVGVVAAAAALILLESRGATDPFFLALTLTTLMALGRFVWLHMSKEEIWVEGGSVEHTRTLMGLGTHHRYQAEYICNLRMDRPKGGVVRFECKGRTARIGYGLPPEVSHRLLEMLETQLAHVGHLPQKG